MEEAKEVMSLAVLKAWEKLPKYAAKIINFKAWICRFTHNLCVDMHRRHKSHAVGVDDIEDLCSQYQELESLHSDLPESALLQEELSHYVRNSIRTLPERLRHPLILRYYHDLSYKAIAQRLSISPHNVAKRIQHAKEELRKNLSQYHNSRHTAVASHTQASMPLEVQDFSIEIETKSAPDEINDRMIISCLETLSPASSHFQTTLVWI